MSETPSFDKEQPDQDPLFYIGPGAYEDSVRYPEEISVHETLPPVEIEQPKRLQELSADEMIAVALSDRLSPDIHNFHDPRRGEFIKKYSWTPYSEMEVTSSIGEDKFGNPPLVSYLLATQKRGGHAAVKNVLNSLDAVRARAVLDIELLREVQNIHTGDFNPDSVRSNPLVLPVLAKAVFARNSLNVFEWPNHYLKKTKHVRPNPKVERKLQSIVDKLKTVPDESLNLLCERTLRHQQARLEFFATQIDEAQAHADTVDMILSARAHA